MTYHPLASVSSSALPTITEEASPSGGMDDGDGDDGDDMTNYSDDSDNQGQSDKALVPFKASETQRSPFPFLTDPVTTTAGRASSIDHPIMRTPAERTTNSATAETSYSHVKQLFNSQTPIAPTSLSTYTSSGVFHAITPTVLNNEAGTCEDMCPLDERLKRDRELDLHQYEKLENNPPTDEQGHPLTLKDTAIKKFQRSSADHELRIPHLLRTPHTLYRTICYIETHIMDGLDEDPSSMMRYLFIWDRYRMIAKDFILQSSSLVKDAVWIECHERMARWYVLMDHRMKANEDYLGGHAQQNLESLNNVLKTLDGYYKNPLFVDSPDADYLLRNQGEFYSYFLLVQLGNTEVVTKFLQSVPARALQSEEMRLALKVAGVLKRGEYAQYFRLMSEATPLQACLMHKYVGELRFTAVTKLCRSLTKQSYYPVSHLMSMLMFDCEEEALEFLSLCGIDVEFDDAEQELCAVFTNQNILRALAEDKNGLPVKPTPWYMGNGIDSRMLDLYTSVVCRGLDRPIDEAWILSKPSTPVKTAVPSITTTAKPFSSSFNAATSGSLAYTSTNAQESLSAMKSVVTQQGSMSTDDQGDSRHFAFPSPIPPSSSVAQPFSFGGFSAPTQPSAPPTSNIFSQMPLASTSFGFSKPPVSADAVDKLAEFKPTLGRPPTSPMSSPRLDASRKKDLLRIRVDTDHSLTPPSFPFQLQQPLSSREDQDESNRKRRVSLSEPPPTSPGQTLPPTVSTDDTAAKEAERQQQQLREAEQRLAEEERKRREEEAALNRQRELEEQQRQQRLRDEQVEQERLRQEQLRREQIERERQAAEAKRLQEEQAELERQRELQRLREEASKEKQLMPLESNIKRFAKKQVLRMLWDRWLSAHSYKCRRYEQAIRGLFFLRWRHVLDKVRQRRASLLRTVTSTSPLKRPRTSPTESRRHTQAFKSRLNLNNHILKQYSARPAAYTSYYTPSTTSTPFYPLTSIRALLGQNFNRLIDSVNPATCLGPILRHQQTLYLRKSLGFSTVSRLSAEYGPVWEGDILYKVGLVTMSSRAGVWSESDYFIENLVRVCLSNTVLPVQGQGQGQESSGSYPLLGDYSENTALKLSRSQQTRAQFLDLCQYSDSSSDLCDRLQSAIVLLPYSFINLITGAATLDPDSAACASFDATLQYIKALLSRGVSLTLIVTYEVLNIRQGHNSYQYSPPQFKWEQVDVERLHMSDNTDGNSGADKLSKSEVMVQESLLALRRLLNDDDVLYYIRAAFLLSTATSSPPSSSHLHQHYTITGSLSNLNTETLQECSINMLECVQHILMHSSQHTYTPLPVIAQEDLFIWLERNIHNYHHNIYNNIQNMPKKKDPESFISHSIRSINDTLDICKAILLRSSVKLSSYQHTFTPFPRPSNSPVAEAAESPLRVVYSPSGPYHALPEDWVESNRQSVTQAIHIIDKLHLPVYADNWESYLSSLERYGWNLPVATYSASDSSNSLNARVRCLVKLVTTRLSQIEEECHSDLAPFPPLFLEVCSDHIPYLTCTVGVSSVLPGAYLAPALDNMYDYNVYARDNEQLDTYPSYTEDDVVSKDQSSSPSDTGVKSGPSVEAKTKPIVDLIVESAYPRPQPDMTSVLDLLQGDKQAQSNLERMLQSALLSTSASYPSDRPVVNMPLSSSVDKRASLSPLIGAEIKKGKRGITDLYSPHTSSSTTSDTQPFSHPHMSADNTDPLSTTSTTTPAVSSKAVRPDDLSEVRAFLKRCRSDRESFDRLVMDELTEL